MKLSSPVVWALLSTSALAAPIVRSDDRQGLAERREACVQWAQRNRLSTDICGVIFDRALRNDDDETNDGEEEGADETMQPLKSRLLPGRRGRDLVVNQLAKRGVEERDPQSVPVHTPSAVNVWTLGAEDHPATPPIHLNEVAPQMGHEWEESNDYWSYTEEVGVIDGDLGYYNNWDDEDGDEGCGSSWSSQGPSHLP